MLRSKSPRAISSKLPLQDRLPSLPENQLWRITNQVNVNTMYDSYSYAALDRFHVQLLEHAPRLLRRSNTRILASLTVYPERHPRQDVEDLAVAASEKIFQLRADEGRLGEQIQAIVGDYS